MNRFHRTELLIGKSGLEKLQNAHVTIAGLGGVGSYAAEALARSGVGHLRIGDSDKISLSNINRQLFALESTIGRYKSEVAKERLHDINPHIEIEEFRSFIDGTTTRQFLDPRPDILIDAIDTLSPKVGLLEEAIALETPSIVSSMGAATRRDPSKIRTADISKTKHCHLARFIRKRLRKRGIKKGIQCVFSLETNPPVKPVEKMEVPEFEEASTTCDGQVRPPLGSLSYIPAIFGFTIAAEAINFLTDRVASN